MKVALLTTDDRQDRREYDRPEPFFGSAPTALLEGFAQSPDLEVHVVSCSQQPVQVPEKLAGNVWFHSLHVPRTGWLRTGYQGCVRAVRAKLRELQPDIVHGQGTERDCALEAVMSGFPNVLTLHGNMREMAQVQKAMPGTYFWWAAMLESFVLKRTLGVVCNSRHTQQTVKSLARMTWLIPNAVRLPFFERPKSTGLEAACRLVNVGVISENKQQVKLLEVAMELRRSQPRLEFLFIGRANPSLPYARAFLEKIREAEAQGAARHLPPQPVEALVGLLDGAAALVHVPQSEAFGLVVAEALTRGLDLFAFKVGGVSDIAEGVPNARLMDAGDWIGMHQAILSWGLKGRAPTQGEEKLMRERYHPTVIARRHIQAYQDVLAAVRRA